MPACRKRASSAYLLCLAQERHARREVDYSGSTDALAAGPQAFYDHPQAANRRAQRVLASGAPEAPPVSGMTDRQQVPPHARTTAPRPTIRQNLGSSQRDNCHELAKNAAQLSSNRHDNWVSRWGGVHVALTCQVPRAQATRTSDTHKLQKLG